MILKNKKVLILSSLLTLLPSLVGLLLWNALPEKIITHWSFDGQPDSMSSPVFAVIFMPLLMLAAQWLCIFFTTKDPGNRGRNQKPLGLVLWIIPLMSNLCCGLMYALSLGVTLPVSNIMVAVMGVMFAAIGNYLPKCKMNFTLGIKIPWTYSSEENWNATHRFGGRVWMVCGLVLLFCALLPAKVSVTVMIAATVVMVGLPTLYSWRYYRMQKARGDALNSMSGANPRITKISLAFLILVLVFVAVILFTGELHYAFGEDILTIEASHYTDLTVRYDTIESIELREEAIPGIRVGGFGSFRLLMGFFENEEFGTYTRYTYYNPDTCIVLTSGDKILVLSAQDAAATRSLYEALLEKTK